MFEINHPFFLPLWRRIAIVLLVFGWAMFEFSNGAEIWSALFCALGVHCFWAFFISFDPDKIKQKDE